MVSVYNVGIPLAFSFSWSENDKIYQRIYDMFLNELAIDLSIFLFESDQGKAFVSFSNHNNIENIVCIRHFLSNLKREKK